MLPCGGAAGVSWFAVSVASMTSQRMGTETVGGAKSEPSRGAGSGGGVDSDGASADSNTVAVCWLSLASGREEGRTGGRER